MLNTDVGTAHEVDGRNFIVTRRGEKGHAVYGPYVALEPGAYAVEFSLALAEKRTLRDGVRCATIDACCDKGALALARTHIVFKDLRDTPTPYRLTFRVKKPCVAEFRVRVTGEVRLQIDDLRPFAPIDDGADVQEILAAQRFPEPPEGETPAFFAENLGELRELHERGGLVAIENGSVVLTVRGVRFHARSKDDVHFIDELFFEGAYDFLLPNRACVIDIGMNSGLASLLFATRENVAEVHSFEPFQDTFARAAANLSLNPKLAPKISARAIGLSNKNEEGEFRVDFGVDAGARSIDPKKDGVAARLVIRDAAETLRPIILGAREKTLDVVMKVDCEGSEFAIFELLDRAGLLGAASAFMVEWHENQAGKTIADLAAPLMRHGYIIFDRGAHRGNGFFYAVNMKSNGALPVAKAKSTALANLKAKLFPSL